MHYTDKENQSSLEREKEHNLLISFILEKKGQRVFSFDLFKIYTQLQVSSSEAQVTIH